MTHPTSTSTARTPWPALLVATLAGLALSYLADGHVVTMVLILATPLWWALALIVALWRWRRSGLRAGLVVLVVAAALLLPQHLALRPGHPSEAAPEEVVSMSRCGRAPPQAEALTIVSLNTHGLDSEAEALALAPSLRGADIIVLQEVQGPDVVDALGRELDGGEAVFVPARWGFGTAVIVPGGRVDRCGGERYTVIELPVLAPRRRAIALLCRVRGVPVVTMHLDRPATWRELVAWPTALKQASAKLASVAALSGDRVVVVGDSNTAPGFHGFFATIEAAGVSFAPARPTWPRTLAGYRSLPWFALDRLAHGGAWHLESVSTQVIGRSDHLALRVRLRRRP